MRTFLPLFFFSAIVYVNLDVADCKLVPVVPVRAWCQGLLLYSSLLSTHASTRTHVRTPTHAYKNLEPGVAPSCTHFRKAEKKRLSVQKANVAWKTFLALLNELWLNFKGQEKAMKFGRDHASVPHDKGGGVNFIPESCSFILTV